MMTSSRGHGLGKPPHLVNRWSTRDFDSFHQRDAWRQALNETHLPWDVSMPAGKGYSAGMRWRRFDGVSLIECACGPCDGQRAAAELRRTDGEYFGLLLLLRGSETIRQGDREARLKAGDFALWDSTAPIAFRVGAGLHKITLMVPRARLGAMMPKPGQALARPVDGRHGMGALFAAHLKTLCTVMPDLGDESDSGVTDVALDLFLKSLDAGHRLPGATLRHVMLRRVQDHIGRHLNDPGLTPTRIAAALGISPRYLHMLYEEQERTVASQIRRLRLERIRRDISDPALRGRTVTEIAFHWGFNDAAHFSRAFKREYGLGPRAFRALNTPPHI